MKTNCRAFLVIAAAIAVAFTSAKAGTSPVSIPLIQQGSIQLSFQTIATGLTAPLEVSSAPDGTGRLFILEQTGKILIFENGALLPTPFIDVTARLVPIMPDYDERGFLGFAFHPDFANAGTPGFGKIYTYTSEPVSGPADFTVPDAAPFDHQSVVAEWQVSDSNPNLIDPATRREIFRVDGPEFNHDGGHLAFRSSDHYLYISLGDGGNANDVGDGHNPRTGNGQDRGTVLGKLLRIDPLNPLLTKGSKDRIGRTKQYRIPMTNPFITIPNSLAEIYAYGLRNPFRFAFDDSDDQLVIGDVGQNNVEEIDIGESGRNYGWNRKEGTFLFNPADGTIKPDTNHDARLKDPVAEYSHLDGIAVIGGYVYRGTLAASVLGGQYVFGDLAGNAGSGRLFYSDLVSHTILEFVPAENNPLQGNFLKGFGRDAQNELYVLIDSNIGPSGTGGTVLKVVGATD